MILFHKEIDFDQPINEKLRVLHDREETMELARDLYAGDESLRSQAIPAVDPDSGEILYYFT